MPARLQQMDRKLPLVPAEPRLSVVIPAYEAEAHLGACLEGLRRQEAEPGCFEVLVVDDASSDSTASLAASFGAQVLIHRQNGGAAAARNSGAQAARGEVLLFLDSDLIPDPQIVNQTLILFDGTAENKDQPTRCATGRYSPEPANNTFFARYKALWTWFCWEQTAGKSGESSHLQGALCAVRRDLFIQLGGFDVRYAGGSVEDYEISQRLRENGERIVFEPGISGKHHFPGFWVVATNYWDRARMYLRLKRQGQAFSSGQANWRSATAAISALGTLGALSLALVVRTLGVLGPPKPISGWEIAAVGISAVCAALYLTASFGFLRFVLRERGSSEALYSFWVHFFLSAIVGAAALTSPIGGGSKRRTACQPEADVYSPPGPNEDGESRSNGPNQDGLLA